MTENTLGPRPELNIHDLQVAVHQNAIDKGFYEGVEFNVPEKLALIHSEISEALEDYRLPDREVNEIWFNDDKNGQPEGFPIELADAVIRILDLAEHAGIDMQFALLTKHNFNTTRPYRHGGKRA